MATVAKRSKGESSTSATTVKMDSKKNKKSKTSWDVDKYKTTYESDEHWELRRNFMLAHQDKFSEEQLVCLAQAFVNIEFMGCKYPLEVMQRVGELSQEVAKEFRESRACRLKRTFVTASNAAEQRAKGRRNNAGATATATTATATANKEYQTKQSYDNSSLAPRHCFGNGDRIDFFEGLHFGNFVVILSGGRGCLRQSAALLKANYEEREGITDNNEKSISIYINGKLVASGNGETVKVAKLAAFKNALRTLQAHCYSIKYNATRDTIKVEKVKNRIVFNVTKDVALDNQAEEKRLDASNKGYRIMRIMGWTGGGLGRHRQGREDPVGYLLKNNRMGLGNGCKLDTQHIRNILNNYKSSDDIRDLQFEPDFTKDERASLHTIASSFSLRSNSYGTGENRRLIISKRINNIEILNEVLLKRNEKFCDRYFVQVPESKAHLFPGHTALLELNGLE